MKYPEQTMLIAGLPVHLRLISQGDEVEIYRVLKPGGSNLDKYQYWDNGFSPEAVKTEVERSISEIEQDKMLRYLIVDNETEGMIGEVSFYDHDASMHTAYFGYLVIPGYEGKHIVSTASRELIKYGTERWQLEKILLEIEVDNAGSEHLAEKLGAQLTDGTKHITGGGKERDMRIWEIKI